MGVLGQRTGGDGADPLGGAVGTLKLGMGGLEGVELAEEPVVLAGLKTLLETGELLTTAGSLQYLRPEAVA